MCCLGFFCIACEMSESDIEGVGNPFGTEYPEQINGIGNRTKEKLLVQLVDANDDDYLPDRESEIARLMKQLTPPVTVEFVD